MIVGFEESLGMKPAIRTTSSAERPVKLMEVMS
jgi:hypothetical protein